MPDAFAGTAQLLRFGVRRDRVLIPAWGAVFLAYTVGGTSAAVALYPDLASRSQAAAAVNGMPALVAMYGRIWDPTSVGSVAMLKPIGFGGVFAAVFATLLVTRHTRAEEESGRLELVRTQAVGWLAPLASALLLAVGVMALLMLVNGAGVTAAGLPAAGAWAFASSVCLTGILFAVIAGAAVQLTQAARTANMLVFAALAGAFVLRGSADAAGTAASTSWWGWLSPLGWQDQVRPFAGDHVWVLALFAPVIALALLLAFRLAGARDFDAGLLPTRDGRASASPSLRSVFALCFRLQRALLGVQLVAYALMSMLLGAIVSNIQGMLDSPEVVDLLTRLGGSNRLVDAFTSFEISFASIVTAVCGVALARRFAAEEQAGRIEPVLATAVARWRVMGGFFMMSLTGTAAMQLVLGLGFGLANGMQLNDFSSFASTLAASLVYLPAIWLVLAITFALMAYAPARSQLTWSVVAIVIVISEFGSMYRWPSALLNVSPFTHVPLMPSHAMAWTPTLLLLLATGLIGGAAFAGYGRRDLAVP